VAIESDDEACRTAEAIIADIGSGDIAAGEDFVSLYTDRNDALWIGRFLTRLLTEALERYNAGDVSPETARLVAFARTLKSARAVSDAESAAATAERAAERRAATVVAIQPAPDIGDRMTGVGLHGLPLYFAWDEPDAVRSSTETDPATGRRRSSPRGSVMPAPCVPGASIRR
jgi:hypothetical protein